MEQDIRFCEVDGRRVAYATLGKGPLLVFSARWITHLEDEWDLPDVRRFFEELARTHRVVRYDRIGVGLSARDLPQPPTVESEARLLGAVLAEFGDEPATIFACSCAGLATATFARANPERVRKIIFFGGYAARDDIPEATRRSLVDFVRTNWPLAAQMLSGLFAPHASGDEIAALSAHKRRSAEADVAAAFLELDLTSDLREVLPHVTAPALVLHAAATGPCRSRAGVSSLRCCRTRASFRSAATHTCRGSKTSASFTARWPASSTTTRRPRSTATRR
jgi:pimeloyl-ACP methyl ester carboxylesterase